MARAARDRWPRLLAELGLPADPAVGTVITTRGDGVPRLSGHVLDARPNGLSLLLEEPAPGTGLLAAEGSDSCGVSAWAYLYGPNAERAAAAHLATWGAWLQRERVRR